MTPASSIALRYASIVVFPIEPAALTPELVRGLTESERDFRTEKDTVPTARSDQIDAKLLHHGPADFGDSHLERDLIFTGDLDQIDDLARLARLVRVADGDIRTATAIAAALARRRERILSCRRLTA